MMGMAEGDGGGGGVCVCQCENVVCVLCDVCALCLCVLCVLCVPCAVSVPVMTKGGTKGRQDNRATPRFPFRAFTAPRTGGRAVVQGVHTKQLAVGGAVLGSMTRGEGEGE
jgi:hypothetical protein